jgi:hypothetical protein
MQNSHVSTSLTSTKRSNATLASQTPQDYASLSDLLHQMNDTTFTSGVATDTSSISLPSDQQLLALLHCFKQKQETIAVMMQYIITHQL